MRTKRQHYIWREYLRKFCFQNDTIYSLINNDKIVPNNLMNVGQEKYFYKIEDFTEQEILFLENFIDDYLKNSGEILIYFKTILKGLKITLLKKTDFISQEFKNEFEEKFQNDFFETILLRNENLGKDFINIKSLEDLEKCLKEKNIILTFLFLSVQLIRTKKQKLIFLENFDYKDINAERVWFFLSYVIGNVLANNLTFSSNYEITLIINNSQNDFITSDQPIINLKDEKDENGIVNHFKLFYPLSPKIALILDFDAKKNHIKEEIITDVNYIKSLNKLIAKNSDTFIFAKTFLALEEIKKGI